MMKVEEKRHWEEILKKKIITVNILIVKLWLLCWDA